jgi:hypothetical protein
VLDAIVALDGHQSATGTGGGDKLGVMIHSLGTAIADGTGAIKVMASGPTDQAQLTVDASGVLQTSGGGDASASNQTAIISKLGDIDTLLGTSNTNTGTTSTNTGSLVNITKGKSAITATDGLQQVLIYGKDNSGDLQPLECDAIGRLNTIGAGKYTLANPAITSGEYNDLSLTSDGKLRVDAAVSVGVLELDNRGATLVNYPTNLSISTASTFLPFVASPAVGNNYGNHFVNKVAYSELTYTFNSSGATSNNQISGYATSTFTSDYPFRCGSGHPLINYNDGSKISNYFYIEFVFSDTPYDFANDGVANAITKISPQRCLVHASSSLLYPLWHGACNVEILGNYMIPILRCASATAGTSPSQNQTIQLRQTYT